MKKWKIAFWILLVIFITTTAFLCYRILDQAVTLTYQKDGYEQLEKDFYQISNIINNDLSCEEAFNEMKKQDSYYFEGYENNIELINASLIFKDGKLDSIQNIHIIDKYCEHCKENN